MAHRIFIFSDDDLEKIILLRGFLKSNGIRRVILVDLGYISMKMVDEEAANIMVEEFPVLERRWGFRDPIIFYGGRYTDYINFLSSRDWYGRKDIGWIDDPYSIKKLKDVIDKINIYNL